MAFRIESSLEPRKKAGRIRNDPYLKWIRQLPCIVSGKYPADAAHISRHNHFYAHEGRGLQSKASDRWTLPLHRDLHEQSHGMNERDFWKQKRIDPYTSALVLWGIYSDGENSLDRATNWIIHGFPNAVGKGWV